VIGHDEPLPALPNERRRVEPRRRNYSFSVVRKPRAAKVILQTAMGPGAVAHSKLTSLSFSLMT
jgi:hypothetical protein